MNGFRTNCFVVHSLCRKRLELALLDLGVFVAAGAVPITFCSSKFSSFTGSKNKNGFICDPARRYPNRSAHMCINICRRLTL